MKLIIDYYKLKITHFIKIMSGGEILIYKNELPHSLVIKSSITGRFFVYPLNKNMEKEELKASTEDIINIMTSIKVLHPNLSSDVIEMDTPTNISILGFSKETILNIVNFKELLDLDEETAGILNTPFYSGADAINDIDIFLTNLKKNTLEPSTDMKDLFERLEFILDSDTSITEKIIRNTFSKLFFDIVLKYTNEKFFYE